jgi:hypothetical protein
MFTDGIAPYSRNTRSGAMTAPLSDLGTTQTLEAQTLRRIVRGAMPIEDLKRTSHAVYARRTEGTIAGQKISPLMVGAEDLAEGIVAFKSDPAALSEWASFILAMSEFFEFGFDDCDYCDRLITHVWDIAFGAPLADPAYRLAHAVTGRSHKR